MAAMCACVPVHLNIVQMSDQSMDFADYINM